MAVSIGAPTTVPQFILYSVIPEAIFCLNLRFSQKIGYVESKIPASAEMTIIYSPRHYPNRKTIIG